MRIPVFPISNNRIICGFLATTKILVLLLAMFSMGSCAQTDRGPHGIFDIDRRYVRTRRNARNRDLFDAVKRSDVEGVRIELKRRGVNPNIADTLGQTALMWASWNGMPDIVELLLGNRQIDVNRSSNRGYTALLCAAHAGRDDIFEMLITRADVRASDDNGETVLHKAIRSGNLEMVRFILADDNLGNLDRDWLINQPDTDDITPLHFAVLLGNERMVNLLLERGADASIPARGRDGQSIHPLYSAFYYRQYSVYVSLLERLETTQVRGILDYAFDDDFRERVDLLEQFGEQGRRGNYRDKYAFSMHRRLNSEEAIEDTAFQSLARQFHDAVRDGTYLEVRRLGDMVYRDIDKFGPRGNDGRDYNFITTAIRRETEGLEVVRYLLRRGFRTSSDESDALVHAAMHADVTDNFEILDQLIFYLRLGYFAEAIRPSGRIDRKYAIRHIVRNEHFLIERGWDDALQHLFRLNAGRIGFRDNHNEWLFTDIVHLGRDSYPVLNEDEKSRLMEVRNRMFEFVFNNFIRRNPSQRSRGIDSRYVIVYLIDYGNFHGANMMLTFTDERARRLLEENVLGSPDTLGRLSTDLHPRYAALAQLRLRSEASE